jgi:hypothetical protein
MASFDAYLIVLDKQPTEGHQRDLKIIVVLISLSTTPIMHDIALQNSAEEKARQEKLKELDDRRYWIKVVKRLINTCLNFTVQTNSITML